MAYKYMYCIFPLKFLANGVILINYKHRWTISSVETALLKTISLICGLLRRPLWFSMPVLKYWQEMELRRLCRENNGCGAKLREVGRGEGYNDNLLRL